MSGLKVGVIGMGLAGPALASALRASGHHLVGVSAHSDRARERADVMLPGTPILSTTELVSVSDLVIVAVPDRQIEPVIGELACNPGWRPGQVVVHLSGALGLAPLRQADEQGALTVALHPVMTFSGTSLDVKNLEGTPVGVTAPAVGLPLARALATDWGGVPFDLEEEARPLYHAALAHGANHVVTLLAQAGRLLRAAGVEDPAAVLSPLVQVAVSRGTTEGMGGLTGPIKRGDQDTVDRHFEAIVADPVVRDLADAYRSLADLTKTELLVFEENRRREEGSL